MSSCLEFIFDNKLLEDFAHLYSIEYKQDCSMFSPISALSYESLSSLELIDTDHKIIDKKLAYVAFEHHRQVLNPDELDKKTIDWIGENKVVMDLCCGPGATVRALMNKNPKLIYAFDQDEVYIKIIKDFANTLGKDKIIPKVADAHNIPVEDKAVDVFFNRVALQYLMIDKVLDEVNRIVRDDGCAIFIVHGSGYAIASAWKRSIRTALTVLLRGIKFNTTKKQSRANEIYVSPNVLVDLLKQRNFKSFSILYSDRKRNIGPFPYYFALKASRD